LENPSVLKPETRRDVFPDLIGFEEPEEDEEGKLLRQMLESQSPITLYLNLGKLGYVKLTGQARIWAYFVCLA
jgi:hypothetical protein